LSKFPRKVRLGTAGAITTAAVVVVALGVLQYRWNQEASDATGVRLADALQLSMINWHLDLFRNLSEVCLTMRMPVDEGNRSDAEQYADRLEEWRSLARYPDLVANVYIVRRKGEQRVEVVPLAPGSQPLDRATLRPVVADVVNALEATSSNGAAPVSEPLPARQLTESFYNIGSALRVWRFDATIPALVRSTLPNAEWILVELNEQVLHERILPDLAHRYFQGTNGLDYEVAVLSGKAGRRVIYSSDPGFGDEEIVDADGRMDVFGRASATSGRTVRVFHRTSTNEGPTAAIGVSWFPLLRQVPVEDDWQLVVRHRRGGPLGSFVAQMRQRGLAVSFIALLALVLSVSMLLVTATRAQRLARLQMDFVTAVSHELRTPLTIIGSAADNIASGVVDTREQLREYGTVIGHEVGQLSGLVERILLFASTRDGRQKYVLEPLSPAGIVDGVLTGTGGLIRAAQFTVEREVEPDLPAVIADRIAVSQCLENLVTNALKYGQEKRWIRLRAALAPGANGEPDAVEISVSDGGMGIEADDLPHIFDPFYRSRAAQKAQIHGTGLGLAVAKQIADSLGSTLTVTSVSGQGSTFTLRLRRFDPTASELSAEGTVVLTPPYILHDGARRRT
jgi:signal transduction histidine kinase